MHTFHLFETDEEIVFDIARSISIMRQFTWSLKTVFSLGIPRLRCHLSVLLSILVPFFLCTGTLNCISICKLAHTENELTGNDLVTECFTHLCNAPKEFHPAGFSAFRKFTKIPCAVSGRELNFASFIE